MSENKLTQVEKIINYANEKFDKGRIDKQILDSILDIVSYLEPYEDVKPNACPGPNGEFIIFWDENNDDFYYEIETHPEEGLFIFFTSRSHSIPAYGEDFPTVKEMMNKLANLIKEHRNYSLENESSK